LRVKVSFYGFAVSFAESLWLSGRLQLDACGSAARGEASQWLEAREAAKPHHRPNHICPVVSTHFNTFGKLWCNR
jgi:hypothetical protein